MPVFLRAVALALLIIEGFLALALGGDYFVAPYLCLTEGVPTTGTLTASAPVRNHASIYYSYAVDGRSCEGLGNGGYGNPANEALHAGDHVLVYYARSRPEWSCIGDPSRGWYTLGTNLAVVAVLSVGLYVRVFRPAAAAGVAWWWYVAFREERGDRRL